MDLICQGGISLPATFDLAIFVKLWEKVRKYSNKNMEVQMQHNFAETS